MNDTERIITEIHKLGDRIGTFESRMDGLDSRMDSLDSRMDSLDSRMNSLDSRMNSLDSRMDGLDSRMDGLDSRMDGLDSKIDAVESKLGGKISEIKLYLENTVQKQINVIAEGHFDLNRKLDEALKIDEEKEKMKLLLLHHDGEINKIKNYLQMNETA